MLNEKLYNTLDKFYGNYVTNLVDECDNHLFSTYNNEDFIINTINKYENKELTYEEFNKMLFDNEPDLYCIIGEIEWGTIRIEEISNYIENEIKPCFEDEEDFEEEFKGMDNVEIVENWLEDVNGYYIYPYGDILIWGEV